MCGFRARLGMRAAGQASVVYGTVRSLLIGLAATLFSGCLITDPIEIPPADDKLLEGLCMCSLCWDRPFCLVADPDNPDGQIAVPRSASEDCPADAIAASTSAAAVDGATETRGTTFHCVRPADNKNLTWPTASCGDTDDPALRSRFGFVDPCIDVPLCARRGEGFTDCPELPDDTIPMCPEVFTGPGRFACREGDATRAVAAEKLEASCAVWGMDIPNGDQPERHCWLGCLDPPEAEEAVCDADTLDPPQIPPFAMRTEVDSTRSRAELTVRIERPVVDRVFDRTLEVAGSVVFEAPRCAPGVDCEIILSLLDIHALGGFTIRRNDFENIGALNMTPIRGTLEAVDDQRSTLILQPSGIVFAGTDWVGEGRLGNTLELTQQIVSAVGRGDRVAQYPRGRRARRPHSSGPEPGGRHRQPPARC